MKHGISQIQKAVVACNRCPRLRRHCKNIAEIKRRAYLDEAYWGRPIPGFGDAAARLMVVGLAPAAHGANRTGRIFTGDRSGDWLFRAMHKAGFASQPTSSRRDDGLKLRDAYVSCVVRCAPPANKPLPDELARCVPFLRDELAALSGVRVYLALGQIAVQGLWPELVRAGLARKEGSGSRRPKFGHGAIHELGDGRWLLMSYHPSQQNTFTGKLTEPMFDSVFAAARSLIHGRPR